VSESRPGNGHSQSPSKAELLQPPLDFVIELLGLNIHVPPESSAIAGIEGSKVDRPEGANYGEHEEAAHNKQITHPINVQLINAKLGSAKI
jgi:hypothetical protein